MKSNFCAGNLVTEPVVVTLQKIKKYTLCNFSGTVGEAWFFVILLVKSSFTRALCRAIITCFSTQACDIQLPRSLKRPPTLSTYPNAGPSTGALLSQTIYSATGKVPEAVAADWVSRPDSNLTC